MRNSRGIFVLIGMTFFSFLGTASAGQFGAPEPAAASRYISVGGGYFYNSDTWKFGSKSQDYKFTQNQIYLQFGAAHQNIEFYIRVGAADFKLGNAFPNGDFTDNYKPFGTMGVKGFIEINSYVGIGLFAQGSIFSSYKSQSVEIKDLNEVDFGLMLQGKINRICVYAGPFLYATHAKAEPTTTGSDSFNQSNNFGGVAGIRIPISKGINFEVEGQYRQEFSAGGAITYSF